MELITFTKQFPRYLRASTLNGGSQLTIIVNLIAYTLPLGIFIQKSSNIKSGERAGYSTNPIGCPIYLFRQKSYHLQDYTQIYYGKRESLYSEFK